MKFPTRAVVGVIAVVVVIIVAGVAIYPGGRGLVGDYRLVRFGNSYQLQDTRQPENSLGNQGAVVRIGWDKTHIVVKRLASPTKGTPWSNEAGWVVIDVNRHQTSDTMTDAEVRQRADVAQIPIYAPDSAYERGHRW